MDKDPPSWPHELRCYSYNRPDWRRGGNRGSIPVRCTKGKPSILLDYQRSVILSCVPRILISCKGEGIKLVNACRMSCYVCALKTPLVCDIAKLQKITLVLFRSAGAHPKCHGMYVSRMVLGVALLYLSCIHIHRQMYDYGSYTLDITGPLMVITQKVTSLAFSLHDGLTRQEDELTANQKYHVVKKMPTLLEYFSFMFHFQALMCGPVVFYRDYMDFIDGTNFLKHAPSSSGKLDNNSNSRKVVFEPSPYLVVFKKVVVSVLCALLYVKLIPSFPIQRVKEAEFVEDTIVPYKMYYLIISTTLVRFKYYHAWLLADAICNASGLGFNGFDQNGNPCWDLISNVDVLKFEFSLSLRDSIEQWNKGTGRWLRMIVYDRVDRCHTLLTYALSALWHGFYPGYYLTFMSGAMFTFASRAFLSIFLVHSQPSPGVVASFPYPTRNSPEYHRSESVVQKEIHEHMYLSLHILGLLVIVLLPLLPTRPLRTATAPHNAANMNGSAHPPQLNGKVTEMSNGFGGGSRG
uniref:Lysophospholipid acyltransferase 2 n=1 Tax=Timema cristinae TaxID=61476 RepID=A0A7R9CZ14_TIMCR|nr:unnamed protein product [Timema cristinae]